MHDAYSSERQEVGSGARQCKEKKVYECLLAVREDKAPLGTSMSGVGSGVVVVGVVE